MSKLRLEVMKGRIRAHAGQKGARPTKHLQSLKRDFLALTEAEQRELLVYCEGMEDGLLIGVCRGVANAITTIKNTHKESGR